jgi:hypothetical protein
MKGAMGTFLKLWRFIWHARIGQMKSIQIRAVIFRESAFWCAQCLEHDVAVQSASLHQLVIELGSTLTSYVELAISEGREPFADLPAAPPHFFEMFGRAHELDPTDAPKMITVDDAPKIVPEIRVLESMAA